MLNIPLASRISYWYALLILLVLFSAATATAAILLIADGDNAAPSVRETGYVSGQSDNFLSPTKAANHLQTYLAVTLWAELTMETATDAPSLIHQALFLPQPHDCVQPTGQPRTNEQILDCVRNAVAQNTGAPSWNSLSRPKRDEAAVAHLANLWRATDPTEQLRVTIIWREGVDPTDAASIHEVQQAYAPCPDRMMAQRSRLVDANGNAQLAQEWLSIAQDLKNCANEVSTGLFAPRASIPRKPHHHPRQAKMKENSHARHDPDPRSPLPELQAHDPQSRQLLRLLRSTQPAITQPTGPETHMNKKRIRANKKRRRYCDAVHRTRKTNGLKDAKTIYDTEEEAWEAIRAFTRNAVMTLEEQTPYLCRATGDHYHVGRRAKITTDDSRQALLDTLKQIPGANKVLRST